MSYNTEFDGYVSIDPPLNPYEIAYLGEFARARHVACHQGPYYLADPREPDVFDRNRPCGGQPNTNCQWVPSLDGTRIEWGGFENFEDAEGWMDYLISTFLAPDAALAREMADPVAGRHYAPAFARFTFDHKVEGVIDARGEESDDRWQLVVQAGKVTVVR